jgi:2-methylisocitrate lyase-like PEP mutase family enzyme
VDAVSGVAAERRARFAELHARDALFVMPNPWDAGSAKLLASVGAEALATTSAGFAWTLGRLDGHVTRDELVAHVAALADATELPLNVDSERCFPDDPGGVAETVRLLGEAGAAGCSIEDWNPVDGRIENVGLATERVAEAAASARAFDPPLVLTGRCENHLHGVDDLDDTLTRLVAYRDAGAECLYAPWILTSEQIGAVVAAAQAPVNVLAAPAAPPVPELARLGVRRVSTGSMLASAAYGTLLAGARELLGDGTSRYAGSSMTQAEREAAFG